METPEGGRLMHSFGLTLLAVDGGVAFSADGLKVLKTPGVKVEVGLAESADERAHKVVDLVARGDNAALHALLAQSTIPLKHLLADAAPAWIVIDELVAAVVVAGWFLWFRFGSVYSRHNSIVVGFFAALFLLVSVAGNDGVVCSPPALGEILALSVGGQHLFIGCTTVSVVVVAVKRTAKLPYKPIYRLLLRFPHDFCHQRC